MLATKAIQPGGGFQLPPEAYYSETWFDLEWQVVFESGWIFVGLIQELPQPNSF